jgi:hypothetical protein
MIDSGIFIFQMKEILNNFINNHWYLRSVKPEFKHSFIMKKLICDGVVSEITKAYMKSWHSLIKLFRPEIAWDS